METPEQNDAVVTQSFFMRFVRQTLAPSMMDFVRASMQPLRHRVNVLAVATQELRAIDPANMFVLARSVARIESLLEAPTVLLRDEKGRITGSRKEIPASIKRLSGAVEIAKSLQRSEALLSAPMVPIKDAKGKMIAARREVPEEPERPADRIGELEKQIAELRARPAMVYKGVWRATEKYSPGSFVTHGGSCWHAECESRGARPGDSALAWKLAVKRGGSR